MNARQKAKKYKRMYEALSARSKPPILLNEKEYKIDTLNFSELLESFPEQSASMVDEDYVREFVADNFTIELVKHFDEYVDYYIEKLPYEHFYRLHYQIKVLRRANNDNNNTR